MELAHAYEQSGNWPDAMDEYRKTALSVAGLDIRLSRSPDAQMNAEKEYEAAQNRFDDHIASLKAAGKFAEAATLQGRIAEMQKTTSLSDQLNATMQASIQAYRQKKIEDAFEDVKHAVEIARQIQPHDSRLPTALDYLGNAYLGRDRSAADAAFEEELRVDTELYGPTSPSLDIPLESLANSAMIQKNYAAAEKYYFQIVDLFSKAYGEGNDQVAMKLVSATRVFIVQKQFDKAEPYLLRAEHIDEATYGEDAGALEYPLASLCWMYDQWNKPDKAEPCYEHYLRVAEKEFGPTSPQIVPLLISQAAVLRKVGRDADADAVEHRAATIRSATMEPTSTENRN